MSGSNDVINRFFNQIQTQVSFKRLSLHDFLTR